MEKVKIYLSNFVINRIFEDCLTYGFIKPNVTSVNINKFLNVVLKNYYQRKVAKRADLLNRLVNEAIIDDIDESKKDKMLDSISRMIDDYYNDDINLFYHHEYVMFYPSKENEIFYDQLYEDEIKHKMSSSTFFRLILNDYCSSAKAIRERIVKQDVYSSVLKGIKNNNLIKIKLSYEDDYIDFAPFHVTSDFFYEQNYLLGTVIDGKTQKIKSFPICNIEKVLTTNKYINFDKSDVDVFKKLLITGVEFASDDVFEVTVYLTYEGVRMLESNIRHRPYMKEFKDNVCTLLTTKENFFKYFIGFGENITILNNDKLKEEFRDFYLRSYTAFCDKK